MAKAIGFTLIPATNLEAVYNHMLHEGTCCLAYADFTSKHVEMLLEGKPELQTLRGSNPDSKDHDDNVWSQLDQEIIQALIGLRMMADCDLLTLHWCQQCKVVSLTAFDCPCNDTFEDGTEKVHFGIDFSEIEVPNYAQVLTDTVNFISELDCETEDYTCNFFLSPWPEAGPYAIIHFLGDCNIARALEVARLNFGAALKFEAQDAHTITAWIHEA